MSLELRFRPEFEFDVREAAAWYETRSPGLGGRFDEVDAGLARIAERSLAYTEVAPRVRQLKLDVFPYLMLYRVHGEFIEIVTVIHGARHPGRRKKRLRDG